jgi:hypothetical protein
VPGIELPSWRGPADDPARVIHTIDAWVLTPALSDLVAAFGGRPPSRAPVALLAWLDEFSAEHWDFRAGRERNLAVVPRLTAEQDGLIADSTVALGLAGQGSPSQSSYDTVLMTGGMVRAGIVKPRFVADLLKGGLSVGNVVFLGGFRAFAGDEIELARALGVEGDDEWSSMVTGMELAFGPLGLPEVSGATEKSGNGSWREYRWAQSMPTFSVLAAPSSAPALRRANSGDTYRFWAKRRAAEERSVLVVTTPVYVPYQGAAAVEVLGLGFGVAVETIGTSDGANDLGEYSQRFTAAHHLQELRSAIRAMRSLREALVAACGE